MSDEPNIWLCFVYGDRWQLSAVYDDEVVAMAWKAGVESGYASAKVVPFRSDGGAFSMPTEEATQ